MSRVYANMRLRPQWLSTWGPVLEGKRKKLRRHSRERGAGEWVGGFKTEEGHGGGGKKAIGGESHGPIWGMGDTGASLGWPGAALSGRLRCMVALRGANHGGPWAPDWDSGPVTGKAPRPAGAWRP
jgi:hypothetical protein